MTKQGEMVRGNASEGQINAMSGGALYRVVWTKQAHFLRLSLSWGSYVYQVVLNGQNIWWGSHMVA